MKELDVKQLTTAGIIAALIFVLTMLHIPNFAGGYIHVGDSLVFFAALLVGPVYGFLAAGIGSMLSDLLSGYAIYAPLTFVIKGCMTLIVYYGYAFLKTKGNAKEGKFGKFGKIFFISAIASGFMVLGYFVAEIFMFNFAYAFANIFGNIIQGGASSALSVVLLVPIETAILYTMRSK